MSPSQIPTPAMPPTGKRPPSSIAQVVQINGDDSTDQATDSPPAEQPKAPPKRENVAPTTGQAKKDEPAGSSPAPSPSGGSGRKGAGRRVEAPAAGSGRPATVRKPLLLNLDDDLKQRMINTVGWTGPRTGPGPPHGVDHPLLQIIVEVEQKRLAHSRGPARACGRRLHPSAGTLPTRTARRRWSWA